MSQASLTERRRIIICGSRTWSNPGPIRQLLKRIPRDSIIVTGGARGADKMAHNLAKEMGFDTEEYPADWDNHQPRWEAGYVRNERMGKLAGVTHVFAFRMPGKSNGTDHMVGIAKRDGYFFRVFPPTPKGADTP